MKYLLGAQGDAALAAALALGPLLAFDFDGTLAPIVARPRDARVSPAVSARLAQLAQLLPVAVVTGRSVDDVRGRLGFEPWAIVGNHGAEDDQVGGAAPARRRLLDPLRERLATNAAELASAGVEVEDKLLSIALHYRRSRQPRHALALIRELLSPRDASLRLFPGKRVENVVPADSPDKAQAVHALVARSGAGSAIFAGDDVNDEPVFVAALPTWLTIRIGRGDSTSRARYFLNNPAEMNLLLDRMLARLAPDGG